MGYLCQWLREKHHHRKLLPVTTTASTRCKGQGARCKGQDQHQRKSERDAATTCNSNHHHYHRPAQDQHGRWWSARCSNHCYLRKGTHFKLLSCPDLTQVAMIAASCTPPAPVLILSWSVVVVVVGVACCCCIPLRLALMLVLTFAPCTLTFAPCACRGCHRQQLTVVVFLPQPLAQIPHLHTWWFNPLLLALVVFILSPTGADTGGSTHCYLRWWCLSFHPLAQILYLHSSYLHCVV